MRHLVFAAVACVALGAQASAASLTEIKERGTLIVGVKADYKPFGFRDPSGGIVGIEPDLAAALAERLGVKAKLLPVIATNRLEFLQQGKIDLIVATMSDKPERRQVVDAVEPLYYADSVNILATKRANLASWEDLRGKPVCATSGAWYNTEVAQSYGAKIVAFEGSEKPLFALQQGNCVGYVYDQTFIQGKLLDGAWSEDYAMPLEGVLETPWMMAVAKGNDELKAAVAEATVGWMKDGTIVALEKKWGIEPTAYSLRMHEAHKDDAS